MTGMRPRQPSLHPISEPPPRDMAPSPFAVILEDFVRRVPGAFAAALVDFEGETVDYVGSVEPFELKVAAAEWRIALEVTRSQPTFASLTGILTRGARLSFHIHLLPDNYALVTILRKRGGFASTTRPLAACERALTREAHWPERALPAWWPAKVDMDARRRPTRLHGATTHHSLDVLGALVGLRKKERGWRVRLDTGAELNLVREPGNYWYADADTR